MSSSRVLVLVLVVAVTGCASPAPATGGPVTAAVAAGGSPGTNAQVCNDIRQTMTDVSQKGVQQLRDSPTVDPAAVAQTYRDAATTIRQQAESGDGDVRRAANKVADEVDKLGDGLAGLADTHTAPRMPDLNGLTAAGRELQQACT